MKFTVKYTEIKNDKELETVCEVFHIKGRRADPYVMTSEIVDLVRKAHPEIEAFIIRDCNVRVWNDGD